MIRCDRRLAAGALVLSGCIACSSSSTPTPGAIDNVQPIQVNAGPAGGYLNGVFTSVTICVPGSATSCQTIDGILVDTGSTGLRILGSVLTLSLPQQTDASGQTIGVCGQFEDGYTWGPVQTADVQMAGEVASAVPLQVIGASGFAAAPPDCTNSGLKSENTLDTLQANGVLGVGVFLQDCGIACSLPGASNPGMYFSCSASSCATTTEALNRQLQNPVALFGSDNNGVVITLPSVPAIGALSTNGSLIFGIGTQQDNGIGNATVLATDLDGSITTVYNGQTYGMSFIDSGSNGIYFLDSATTGLPVCTDNADFYCPSTAQTFSATNRGGNGRTAPVTFTVGNADMLSSLLNAFSNVAGPHPGAFDWGMPFFFGRTVFTAIEGRSTPGGNGPYVAY